MPDDFASAAGDSGAGSSPVGDSTTASAVTPESTPAGELAQPGVDSAPGHEGPVPYPRFKEVNDKYGALRWAESYQPNTVQQQKQFFDWLDRDPEGAHNYLTDYLTRSGALRRQPAALPSPNGNGQPQPDMVIPETGQRLYSAEAAEKLAKWQAEQIINERLGPIEQAVQRQDQDRVQSQANQAATQQLVEADTWLHFKGNEREILALMESDHRLSLEGAYRKVVFPRLRELERKAIVAETHQKAQAGTVNPGSVAATTKIPTSKMSMSELFRREFQKRSAG